MATIKSYTDFSQSKVLSEILPLESADMHWSKDFDGRCLVCDAGTPSNKSIRCDIIHDRDCPCKYNQCLKYK